MGASSQSDRPPRKEICIPASAAVDISDFVPLVDHPLMQRLKFRKQLGVNHLVFPGAGHTRFEHALGVLGLTQHLCRIHDLRGALRRHLCAFALLHDIGHGPFSHQTEPIIAGTHHERGILCLESMNPTLNACGLDPGHLRALFRGDDPAGQYVTDRNLGTDKLDYLRRDALHIGFTGTPEIERLQLYTRMAGNVLAVEEKRIEDIKRLQKFYSYLHQHGYLNKTALSLQRLLQRAVQAELAEGHTHPDRVWEMTDMELVGWLRHGESRLAQWLLARFTGRDFHRSLLVIKPAGYGFAERTAGKNVLTLEWPKSRIRSFSTAYADSDAVTRLEDELAARCGVQAGEILFAAMPYFDKLVPRDVRIFSGGRHGGFWLFEKDKDHLRSLQGDYLRTFAIRVIVPPERRVALADRVREIARFLEARLGQGRRSVSA